MPTLIFQLEREAASVSVAGQTRLRGNDVIDVTLALPSCKVSADAGGNAKPSRNAACGRERWWCRGSRCRDGRGTAVPYVVVVVAVVEPGMHRSEKQQ